MGSLKGIQKIAGWLVFAIALTVYYFSAERVGSLWDCGEFILGAYKLQVVHPPGAPLFVLIGRMFTWVASLLSSDPQDIAFAVNLMSGICTAFAAALICWTTIILGKLAVSGRDEEPDTGQAIAIGGAGLVAGLATAFCSSVWFSAVEGEVYAMSTFFTTLTLWSTVKWFSLPDTPQSDRWLFFTIYAAGLSIGVHLLSLLTFPALALFYYFKKYKEHTFLGMAAAAGAGVLIIAAVQKLVIVGLPKMWAFFDLIMVNDLGLPFNSGIIPTLLFVAGVIYFGLRYAHKNGNALVQNITVSALLFVIAFSTIGIVVIRANVDPPINMNRPTDPFRLVPYLNREQYGERPLVYGPSFEGRIKRDGTGYEFSDRYGRVGDHYEYTDYKVDVNYEPADMMLFPRMGDGTQNRPRQYKRWMGLNPDKPLPSTRPNQIDNISFLVSYQIGWMYFRYFMWNFSGRQNGEQGFEPWDKSKGHWITGIKFLDELRLGNLDKLPESELKDPARNKYYALPFLFGLIGLFFHARRRKNDFIALMSLFIITGIGIIIYSNQPPMEPRERDYVLVGSFFTFCIWIGMGVLAIFSLARRFMQQSSPVTAVLSTLIVLSAPILMGTQNFDDHSRMHITASRDYASNFLNSVEKNAIIFTYGDNDTYPLWYAQEVENIRTDVRVVNLSLIAVDWYIDLLRRKVNDSPPLKLTIPSDKYRGKNRNQVPFYTPAANDQNYNPARDPRISIDAFLRELAKDKPLPAASGREFETHYETHNLYIPVNKAEVLNKGVVPESDTANIVSEIPITIRQDYLIKDDIAILDVIASNLWDRPVYFAVTCRPEKFFGLDDYMQLEGLALRIIPVRTRGESIYGVLGSGRVDTEKFYENVMTKFRWGNFDKMHLFVDRSYTPSIQSMQFGIRRAAFALLREDKRDKALALIDKYFESFPEMNFPYDYRTMMMLDVYFEANAYDKAKPHLEILAKETKDHLAFYESLSNKTLATSYESDFRVAYNVMDRILEEIKKNNDTEFYEKMQAFFKPVMLEDSQEEDPGSIPVLDDLDSPDIQ